MGRNPKEESSIYWVLTYPKSAWFTYRQELSRKQTNKPRQKRRCNDDTELGRHREQETDALWDTAQ